MIYSTTAVIFLIMTIFFLVFAFIALWFYFKQNNTLWIFIALICFSFGFFGLFINEKNKISTTEYQDLLKKHIQERNLLKLKQKEELNKITPRNNT